ncbi:UvrD-helicase domain-containing protein [Brevibacillus fulvus]|uniref:DNA 3'-5' helicase n=1 Tax=Brevibacillus fulvus TaxID=1125967 RepID=A0A939BPV9_9BACL|nr:ATP-dependent helicase [Brevibacillus fulvus]MBM7590940.1 DNA helicase-2/ATP-dependent DNA helicase PcrA [Brevibacillus fulvus]
MKFALLDDELIFLQESTYSRIPSWRMRAVRGDLRCPGCGAALRLVAGISFEPLFSHTAEPCPLQGLEQPPEHLLVHRSGEETAATVAALPASDQRTFGSYRLPTGKPIGNTAGSGERPKSEAAFRKKLRPRHAIPHLAERPPDPLHPEQKRAVLSTEGPLLILAGAGSGKTRVMSARAAHLVQDKGVDPRSIMIVTFTAKAAEEMKRRLSNQLTAQQTSRLICGTFHSIFYRMLLFHQPERWQQERLLKFDWQKRRLLQESGQLHDAELAGRKDAEIDGALGVISRWKNAFITPDALEQLDCANEEEKLAKQLYPVYETAKQAYRYFDFDDMLLGCYQLLQSEPAILARYQERIHYVMIDEFQDINRLQYETVRMLAAPQNNLCVIGDDDQSIYAFRGSDPRFILGFTKDYPAAQTITLEVNYRSHASIVGLGYSLIGNNRIRWKKEFKTYHQEEGESYLFYPEDEEEQAARIVDEIRQQLAEGASPGQFAVLFRTYESTRPIIEQFIQAALPFQFTHEQELFYDKQVVKWALGYLRLALDPDDSSALREILSTLYISHEQWNAIRSQAILDDCSLLEVLPKLPNWKSYQRQHLQKVVEILRALPTCSPRQALELVYEDGKLRDYVRKRMKESHSASQTSWQDDLQQLLTAAKRHDSLPQFLAHLADMNHQAKTLRKQYAAASEAIQVLSIHRAKGLEFDTVFLLDLVEGALPHEYALDELRKQQSHALEEERRLLYVAITRAKRKLCIGIPLERFGRKTKVSRFIAEMEK